MSNNNNASTTNNISDYETDGGGGYGVAMDGGSWDQNPMMQDGHQYQGSDGGYDDQNYGPNDNTMYHRDGSYQGDDGGYGEYQDDGQYPADDGQPPYDEAMEGGYDDQQPSTDPTHQDTPLRSNTRPSRVSTGHEYQSEEYGVDEDGQQYAEEQGDAMDEHGSVTQEEEGPPSNKPMIQKDSIVQEVKVMVDEKLNNMRFHTNKLLQELELYVDTLGKTEATYLAVQEDVHAEADHLDRCEEDVERAIAGLGLSMQQQQMQQQQMLSQDGMAGAMHLSALGAAGRRNSHDSQGSRRKKSGGRLSRQGSFEENA